MTRLLTVDLGTSVTKVALWDETGMLAAGRVPLRTVHGPSGRVEQDPDSWWASVVEGCRQTMGDRPAGAAAAPEAVVLTGARQTFVPVDGGGDPIGAALVWSDRRATEEAVELRRQRQLAPKGVCVTGPPLDGASLTAKMAWLARHEPSRLDRARWLVGPRDLVAWRLCGELATDSTMASATGLYDAHGQVVALARDHAELLPPVVNAGTVVGKAGEAEGRALGVPPGTPVVLGAADRPSEVLGSGAEAGRAMVAWGTTANVSLPVDRLPDPLPSELSITRAAADGWLLEGGVSAAGSLLEWLATFTGTEVEQLLVATENVGPGADGLVVLPWLFGARAPWWHDGAGAALVGLGAQHDAGAVARAALEAVACELTRCLEAMARHGRSAEALAVGGSSATGLLWLEILAAVSGLAWLRRRSGEAALAGAAIIGARALGLTWRLDDLDPVTSQGTPEPTLSEHYRRLRPRWDEAALAVIRLGAHDATVASPH
ncbi:MAG TPA: FGGY family carbohydrate kinase [Acidimicrobiales bacterium]|nr:FGGY family carbohydrate kinase [Acidimicrobiales bacterium]